MVVLSLITNNDLFALSVSQLFSLIDGKMIGNLENTCLDAETGAFILLSFSIIFGGSRQRIIYLMYAEQPYGWKYPACESEFVGV